MKTTITSSLFVLLILVENSCCGSCPRRCLTGEICPYSECPYDRCIPGYWGLHCEHALECLLPEDNGFYYRGTQNVTSDKRPCINWDASSTFAVPPDGRHHNYCRHSDSTPNTWCYTAVNGDNRWGHCNVPLCDTWCPVPMIQSRSLLTNEHMPMMFSVGSVINVQCETGYVMQGKCEQLECLLPGDNGVHYRGTQNTTSDGTPCVNWDSSADFDRPTDDTHQNYCRNKKNQRGPWCYIAVGSSGPYRAELCSIPLCDAETLETIGNCSKGYRENYDFLYANVSIQCMDNKNWSNHLPQCKTSNIECSIKSLPSNSLITNTTPSSSYKLSSNVSIRCLSGFRLTGSSRLVCSLNSTWIPSTQCEDINECLKKPCRPHANCINILGSYMCQCMKGYTKDRYGNCLVNHCQRPILYKHSSLVKSVLNIEYKDTITVQCDEGYTISGKDSLVLTCQADKTYDLEPPMCQAVCGIPQLNPNTYILSEHELYTYNDTLEISCNAGYETNDERFFICQDDTQWNGSMPYCNASTFECSSNSLPLNSFIANMTASSSYKLSSSVSIRCLSGYQLTGSSRLVCSVKSTWIPSTQCEDINECLKKPCRQHANCINIPGSYTCQCMKGYTKDSYGNCFVNHCQRPILYKHSSLVKSVFNIEYKNTITVRCDVGYTVSGKDSFTLTCQADKTYDLEPPVCQAVCGIPQLNPNTYILNEHELYTYNETLEISCNAGYETNDERFFICQDDTQWNGSMPYCNEIPNGNGSKHSRMDTKYIIICTIVVLAVVILVVVAVFVFRRKYGQKLRGSSPELLNLQGMDSN